MVTVIPVLICRTRNSSKRYGKVIGGTGNQRKNGDHIDHRIAEIDENTSNSPGDQMRLVATQTPVKDHQSKTRS